MRDHDEPAAVPGPPDEAGDWPAAFRPGDPVRSLNPSDLEEDLLAAGLDPSLLGGSD